MTTSLLPGADGLFDGPQAKAMNHQQRLISSVPIHKPLVTENTRGAEAFKSLFLFRSRLIGGASSFINQQAAASTGHILGSAP